MLFYSDRQNRGIRNRLGCGSRHRLPKVVGRCKTCSQGRLRLILLFRQVHRDSRRSSYSRRSVSWTRVACRHSPHPVPRGRSPRFWTSGTCLAQTLLSHTRCRNIVLRSYSRLGPYLYIASRVLNDRTPRT